VFDIFHHFCTQCTHTVGTVRGIKCMPLMCARSARIVFHVICTFSHTSLNIPYLLPVPQALLLEAPNRAPKRRDGKKARKVRHAKAPAGTRIERPEHLCFAPGQASKFAWTGLIGWLGSEGGRHEFRNVADAGLVRVTSSSAWGWGRCENVVEGAPKVSCSASEVMWSPVT
jgi:hypothetical protein